MKKTVKKTLFAGMLGAIGLILAVLAASCGSEAIAPEPDNLTAPGVNQPFDADVFEAEKAAWKSRGLNHYQFTRKFNTTQPLPVLTVKVTPDKEPAAVFSDNSDQWPDGELDFFGRTVDEIYTVFLEHFVPENGEGYSISIRYNAEYHYPEWFERKIILPAGHTGAGGWLGFEVTHFEALGK